MDRFIVLAYQMIDFYHNNLKSNMDRFIVHLLSWLHYTTINLKSNMDRFIEYNDFPILSVARGFKIQYG